MKISLQSFAKNNTKIMKEMTYSQINHAKAWGFKALWAKGYYCGSAGHVSQEQVKRYILEQEGKDVFEYSIFGDTTGQTKIGDFSC